MSRRPCTRGRAFAPSCFNPRLLVDEQATTASTRATSRKRCFNPRLLVDEQATGTSLRRAALGRVSTHACSLMSRRPVRVTSDNKTNPVSTHACSLMSRRLAVPATLAEPEVSTHACSLMSRRRPGWKHIRAPRCFNPRLLVDEQATCARTTLVVVSSVSTHACSLMSRRPSEAARMMPEYAVSTHACSLMSRRPRCRPPRPTWTGFNPRLLVDEQATAMRRSRAPARRFNPRLLVDEQATLAAGEPVAALQVSTHACSLMSRRLTYCATASPSLPFQPTPAR